MTWDLPAVLDRQDSVEVPELLVPWVRLERKVSVDVLAKMVKPDLLVTQVRLVAEDPKEWPDRLELPDFLDLLVLAASQVQ